MNLDDLKARIITTLDDAVLQVKLDDTIDFVCGYLNQTFDEDNPMPLRVMRIIAKYVDSDIIQSRNGGVSSETIGGMSQTFESRDAWEGSLKADLKATGLRKLRW